MNERQAIEFIMQELKEQRRHDFEMYFEMRKNTTETYDRFLDRLREIDEADRLMNGKEAMQTVTSPVVTTLEQRLWKPNERPAHLLTEGKLQPWTNMEDRVAIQRAVEKELPVSKAHHMDLTELKLDRLMVEKEPVPHDRGKRSLVPTEETVKAIEGFLRNLPIHRPVKLSQIQAFCEIKFQVHWTNFNDVMKRALTLSPYIHVDKSGGKRNIMYSYKQV